MGHHLLERVFTVGVPVSTAWALLSDVESWPDWAPHIRAARLDEPLGVGTRGSFRFRPVGSATFTVTDWLPTSNWTWRGRAVGNTIDYHHRFSSIDAGSTELTWVVELAKGRPGPRSSLFTRIYERNIDQAWPSFVAWCDQAAAEG